MKMKIGYGEFIKKHRLASGFKSQRKLADKSGISAATISRIESEIQKPEVSTLQTLAQYLETTSYVELMVVCGYWDKEDLLEDIGDEEDNDYVRESTRLYIATDNVDENKKSPCNHEEDLIKSINLSDDDLLEKFDLKIDDQCLTEDEAKGIIAYIRSLRQVQKTNQNKD